MNRISFIAFSVLLTTVIYSCNSNPGKKASDSSAVKPDSQQNLVQAKKSGSGNIRAIDTGLVFPNYTVKLHNFKFFQASDVGYDDDTLALSQNKMWGLKIKSDTTQVQASIGDNDILEIIPKDKTDSFKISYTSVINISEYPSRKDGVYAPITPPYKPLNGVSNNYNVLASAFTNTYASTIKKDMKLKDTTIKVYDNNGKAYTYNLIVYKNKACGVEGTSPTFFKIERFSGTRLLETKIIEITDTNTEDGDSDY